MYKPFSPASESKSCEKEKKIKQGAFFFHMIDMKRWQV